MLKPRRNLRQLTLVTPVLHSSFPDATQDPLFPHSSAVLSSKSLESMSAPFDLRLFLDSLTKGQPLGKDEAHEVCGAIADGRADPVQVAALLALIQSIKPSAGTVSGFASAMRDRCNGVTIDGEVVDIVGTGGDGHNTVNISTSAAVVAASCGATVAKHGNASVSSRSGSADVLKSLGIRMLPPGDIASCVASCGMAFMFAPLFHPAMRHVVPVRKALKIRTIFNILGPLLNPAGARRLMLGVYHPDLLPIYGEALRTLGVEHAIVVHCGGLDELAPIGIAHAVEVRRGEAVKTLEIDTLALGLQECSIDDLRGGEPEENAAIIRRVLAGGAKGREVHIAETIALNAGAALYVSG